MNVSSIFPNDRRVSAAILTGGLIVQAASDAYVYWAGGKKRGSRDAAKRAAFIRVVGSAGVIYGAAAFLIPTVQQLAAKEAPAGDDPAGGGFDLKVEQPRLPGNVAPGGGGVVESGGWFDEMLRQGDVQT